MHINLRTYIYAAIARSMMNSFAPYGVHLMKVFSSFTSI